MSEIIEYKYKGKLAYKGKSICPSCGNGFELDTTDKSLFDKSLCFTYFMNKECGTNVKPKDFE